MVNEMVSTRPRRLCTMKWKINKYRKSWTVIKAILIMDQRLEMEYHNSTFVFLSGPEVERGTGDASYIHYMFVNSRRIRIMDL